MIGDALGRNCQGMTVPALSDARRRKCRRSKESGLLGCVALCKPRGKLKILKKIIMDFGRVKALKYVNGSGIYYRLATCTTPPLLITNKLAPNNLDNPCSVNLFVHHDHHIYMNTGSQMIIMQVNGEPNEEMCDAILRGMFPQISEIIMDVTLGTGNPWPQPVDYDTYMEQLDKKTSGLARRDAAITIQERYRVALLNPYCKIGFKHINRQYDSFLNDE